jgi:hypothetical protein
MHETDENFIEHSWEIAEETNSGPTVNEDNIKINFKGVGQNSVGWIYLT